MAAANHIGKILVTVDLESTVHATDTCPTSFDSDAIYMLTGGLGALGTSVAQWMCWHGATKIALVDLPFAREPTEVLNRLRSAGANISIHRCDITDPTAVDSLFAELTAIAPIGGIMHCAGFVDDYFVKDLTRDRLNKVLAPKVSGAWNLHLASLKLKTPLSFFVLFGSIAAEMGAPGQANYAAGNSFLNGLSHKRRKMGLPCLSINWGPILAGMTAKLPENVRRGMQAQGLVILSSSEVVDLLGSLIFTNTPLPPHIAVVRIDWAQWAAFSPTSQNPRFQNVVKLAGAQSSAGKLFMQKMLALPAGTQRLEMMQRRIVETISTVLSFKPDQVDVNKPLTDMGLDSMVAVEVRAKLEQEVGIPISIVLLMGGPPISKIALALVTQMEGMSSSSGVQETTAKPVEEASVITTMTNPDSKKHVFLFPPAGGNQTIFSSFAPLMENWAVHVVQRGYNVTDLTALVNSNIAAILATCKEPYTIVGHSAGGIVGQLVATKLISMGHKVESLVLIDATHVSDKSASNVEDSMCLFVRGQGRMSGVAAAALRAELKVLPDEKAKWDHFFAACKYETAQERQWDHFFAACKYETAQERQVAQDLVKNLMQDIHLTDQALPLVDSLLLQSSESSSSSSAGTPESASSLELWNVPVLTVWASNNDEFVRSLLQLDTAPKSWTNTLTRLSNRPPQPEDKGRATLSLGSATTPGDHWTMFSPPDNVTTLAHTVLTFINTNHP
ncbi:alpha/beta fold hydrolase [Pelomyxa schiedti]|nr:alpha/beta fold hydrolase [Pelomyxa schiedti]